MSDFIGTFQETEEDKYHLQLLNYFPETQQVVGKSEFRDTNYKVSEFGYI